MPAACNSSTAFSPLQLSTYIEIFTYQSKYIEDDISEALDPKSVYKLNYFDQVRCGLLGYMTSGTSKQISRSTADWSIYYLLQIPLTIIIYSKKWLAANIFWVLDNSTVNLQDPYKILGQLKKPRDKTQSGVPLTLMRNAQNPILTVCFLEIVSRLELPVIIHHRINKNIQEISIA